MSEKYMTRGCENDERVSGEGIQQQYLNLASEKFAAMWL